MPLTRYSLLDAAKLLQETRNSIKGGLRRAPLVDVTAARANVAAGLTGDNVLVITGSRGGTDYAFYNLRPLRPLPAMAEIEEITTADLPKKAYHQGFLLHAARVKRFLAGRRPDIIVGHSLGAASAQILGAHFEVPTIGLASPQVVKRRYLEAAALRARGHRQWHVFNMAWRQDFVTRGYRELGLRCLGHRVVVDTNQQNFGVDHFVSQYEDLIVTALDQQLAGLPQHWPDASFAPPSRLA
ncbi:MAG: hypothetical protein AAFM92_00490 [Pseudomonadota bacterium]